MTMNNKKLPLRVTVYTRVASKEDAMLRPLEARTQKYKEYISGHHYWELCGVYCDDGISGMKTHRPALDKMFKQCRAGKVDIILTDDVSTLGRKATAVLQMMQELKGLGIDVAFCDNVRCLCQEL